MRIQRVETVYDQGNTKYPEDGHIAIRHHGLFGVVDGYSAPYAGEPRLFDGKSGGQVVTETVLDEFFHYSAGFPLLIQSLSIANEKLAWKWKRQNIAIEQTHLLAGASFVFIQIMKDVVNIIQAGDCLAVWEYWPDQKGIVSIGGTKNLAYRSVSENIATLQSLAKKHGGDKLKMWTEFLPILSAQRDTDVNQPDGYGVLNGQYDAPRYWQETRIPIAGLAHIMLFSDGFVESYDATENIDSLAHALFSRYDILALANMLNSQRIARPVTDDEATAIAITFDR